LSPRNGCALHEKGRLLFAADRLDEAAAALAEAEPLVPAAARFAVRMQLGLTWRTMDRYDEALQAFRRAADEDNEVSDAHAYVAAALMEIAEYGDAAEVLERAIARIPSETADAQEKKALSWLWMMRGWALSRTGRSTAELQQIFRTATALNPANPHARMKLAWSLSHEPEGRGEGERIMRDLITEADTASIPKDVVGWCHYMLKQEDLAERWLRGAIDAAPADPATRFDLALVLLVLESGDAKKEYQRATRLAQERSAPRQRGLFHGAMWDLNEAVEEGRVDVERSEPTRRSLWEALKAAGLRAEELKPA
jgi:tetratricopeptide (TPR) repeat protein